MGRTYAKRPGRQGKKWSANLKVTAGALWTRIAKDRPAWKSLEVYGYTMVNVCCVAGCKETKEVTYFNVPNSKTLRKKWLENFIPNCKVTNLSVICSRHFLDNQYDEVRGKKRLKPKVVPTVFFNLDDTLIKKDGFKKKSNKNKTNVISEEEETSKPVENKSEEQNSVSEDNDDEIVKRSEPNVADIDIADIEEIITNYQIKQIRPINRISTNNIQNGDNGEGGEIEDMITNFQIRQTRPRSLSAPPGFGQESEVPRVESEYEMENVIDVDNLEEPVYVEVSVDKAGEGEQSENQDCLMLLESVQCEVDPTSLMFHDQDPDPDPDPDEDDDVIEVERKEEPISLLTSSDEDDVILEEPHIDTVDVSDETDEDDVPLVKLVDKPDKKDISKMMWGLYEYYCMECHYTTSNKADYKKHKETHEKVFHICQLCGYTTSSKSQLVRHQRKHSDGKKFKCHLCEYKARHNMSLIYHLKTHDSIQLVSVKRGYKCGKCQFESNDKVKLVKHLKLCDSGSCYKCDKCKYETDRKSALKRHKKMQHDDVDYVPPAWVS